VARSPAAATVAADCGRRLAQLAAAVGWRRRLARSALDNALISLARPGTN
jgi:hypothetical protein